MGYPGHFLQYYIAFLISLPGLLWRKGAGSFWGLLFFSVAVHFFFIVLHPFSLNPFPFSIPFFFIIFCGIFLELEHGGRELILYMPERQKLVIKGG